MQSFTKLTLTQLKLYLREPVAFFFTLVFPVLVLLLFGVIWGNEPGFSGEYGYIDAAVPALAGIVVGTVALMTIPIATATAREQKILRRFKATPMRPATYIAAEIVTNVLVAFVGMILLIIVGIIVFDMRFDGNWLLVFIGFLISTLAFVAVGYVIASLSPTSRVAQVAGQLVFFPMMFLSGATIPLATMPEGVQNVAQLLPMTHLVKMMQDLWFGLPWNWTATAVLAVMLVIGAVVSAQLFQWE